MQLLRLLLNRSRRTLVLAIALGLISGGLNSSLLALANAVIVSRAKSMHVLPAFAGLCLMAMLARIASETLLAFMGQDAIFALRTQLSSQVLAEPLRQLEQIGPNRILSVLTDDVPSIAGVIGAIPLICINAGVVLGCLGFMAWLQWKLLVAVLAFMMVGVLTYQLGITKAARHFQRARDHDNDLHKHFRSLIYGIKELKLHEGRSDSFLSNALGRTAHDVRNENVAGLIVFILAASWGQLLVFLAIGFIAFFLAGLLNAGAEVVTGASLALLYCMTPLQVIMNSVPALARANVAIGNTRKLGFTLVNPETSRSSDALTNSSAWSGRVELIGVTHSYQQQDSDYEFTLGPIDLTVNPGELLFVTGGNGSGKTTLAKLLLGLYSPKSGEVRYNGELVTETNRMAYRQLFSAIFSDFFLFDTLQGLGCAELDQRAKEYLSSLRLENKVSVRHGVLSTTDLSQGQRKRLALLAACLEDRPIYLFDEWAADQDPAFKEVFYFDILPGLKTRGKSVIVISHDDRYYGVADRIVSLESGRLSRSGIYPGAEAERGSFR